MKLRENNRCIAVMYDGIMYYVAQTDDSTQSDMLELHAVYTGVLAYAPLEDVVVCDD